MFRIDAANSRLSPELDESNVSVIQDVTS